MIISVTSPVRGQAGTTTAALLTGILLAASNKSVCLTHLSSQSSAFHTYLGLDALEDKTCTPSQVVKLLREGAIGPQDMADYCIRVSDNLDIFSNNSTAFSDEDMELTQQFVLDNMPHDFIVLDVDIAGSSPLRTLAEEKTDLELVCLTQSVSVVNRHGETDKRAHKTLVLCNHYAQAVGSVALFAKRVGADKRDCLPLHHAPLLMKLANEGKLADLLPLAASLPLPDIAADLERLCAAVLRQHKVHVGVKK